MKTSLMLQAKTLMLILAILAPIFTFAQMKVEQKNKKKQHLELQTVDQLSRKFINSFRKQNFDALFELFPPQKEVKALFTQMIPEGGKRDTTLMNIEKIYTDRYYNYYRKEFKGIVDMGKRLEIDWMRLRYVKADYCVTENGEYKVAYPTKVTTKHRNKFYEVLIHPVKVNGGWYLLPIIDDEAAISKMAPSKKPKKNRKV